MILNLCNVVISTLKETQNLSLSSIFQLPVLFSLDWQSQNNEQNNINTSINFSKI